MWFLQDRYEVTRAVNNEFYARSPFNYVVMDGFFKWSVADELYSEFMAFEDPRWLSYTSDVQIKKACNNWNAFPPTTYRVFQDLMSKEFINLIDYSLLPDYGLHGGGWHAHRNGGRLGPHLDYSIHPKLGKERKLNLLVYLTPGMRPEYGGHLGLYYGNATAPGEVAAEIEPKFNRAVLFDTTQNSWHGMSRELAMPDCTWVRRSLATYYLSEPGASAVQERQHAHFHGDGI
jgi:hypothetical protein